MMGGDLPLAHVLPVPLDAEDEVDDVEHIVEVLRDGLKKRNGFYSTKLFCVKYDLWQRS